MLTNLIAPILAAGPEQLGYSAGQKANLETTNLDSVGQDYASAAKALNNATAGSGGTSGLESGVEAQVKGELGGEAAGLEANNELGIEQADYAQGNANYSQALGGQQALATDYNPEGYGGLANTANETAFNEATQIQQENNAGIASLVSGITGLAGLGANVGFSGASSSAGEDTGTYDPSLSDAQADAADPYLSGSVAGNSGVSAADTGLGM